MMMMMIQILGKILKDIMSDINIFVIFIKQIVKLQLEPVKRVIN